MQCLGHTSIFIRYLKFRFSQVSHFVVVVICLFFFDKPGNSLPPTPSAELMSQLWGLLPRHAWSMSFACSSAQHSAGARKCLLTLFWETANGRISESWFWWSLECLKQKGDSFSPIPAPPPPNPCYHQKPTLEVLIKEVACHPCPSLIYKVREEPGHLHF